MKKQEDKDWDCPTNICKTFTHAFTIDEYQGHRGKFKIGYLKDALLSSTYSCTVLFRLSQYYLKKSFNNSSKLKLKYYKLLECLCFRLNFILNGGAEISLYADIEPGIFIHHCQGLLIGGNTKIGKNCHVFKDVLFGLKTGLDRKFPVIKDNVTIYTGARIMGGITIGDNAVIGANSICLKEVLPNEIVVGTPARVVGKNDLIWIQKGRIPVQIKEINKEGK